MQGAGFKTRSPACFLNAMIYQEIMGIDKKITIEVMYKSDACLPCFYMDEAVKEILPLYDHLLSYNRVDIQSKSGKQRFLDLSVDLFGEEGVYTHKRIAPIPSLFFDGELFFDAIPPRHELEAAIQEMIEQNHGGNDKIPELVLEVLHEGEH